MALIFPRLARNFIKNGYFPTDELSIERILHMLEPTQGAVQMIDPCCGEGTALAELAHYFRESGMAVTTAGIEFDAERAAHSKTMLDHVVHADMQDCVVGSGQFNLLFLNPPYGDRVTDQTSMEANRQGRDRLEKYFLTRSMPMLCYGGLLIYIIPNTILDKNLSKQLARSLDSLSIYRLPEDRFKQVVITGYRRRSDTAGVSSVVNHLLAVGEDRSLAPELPEVPERFYSVNGLPQVKPLDVRSVKPTVESVLEVKQRHSCLWADFNNHFSQKVCDRRRPARKLSDWHLALMLAAGQLSGTVMSGDGRKLMVKGSTHKVKEMSLSFQEGDDGSVVETHSAIDRFVPVIKGIDVTEGTGSFGEVFTIK